MRSLVFGGSAGVGRALCRALAAEGHDLTIVSRSAADLEAESSHCHLLHGGDVDWIAIDAADPRSLRSALTTHLTNTAHLFENLFFPIGGAAQSDCIDNADEVFVQTTHTNLTSVMVAISSLLPHMATEGCRNIVGFGSIAAVRGRRSNVAYSAAKRGLESYFESLQHMVAAEGISIQFYRLGYIETQQSFGKSLPLPAMRPSAVAQHVLNNMGRNVGVRSLPRFWAGVTPIIKHLPWWLFRRLNF
jgi:NAD(P)-dependent dehydrogenase (short-subunit alcohol dehydrogenase family)